MPYHYLYPKSLKDNNVYRGIKTAAGQQLTDTTGYSKYLESVGSLKYFSEKNIYLPNDGPYYFPFDLEFEEYDILKLDDAPISGLIISDKFLKIIHDIQITSHVICPIDIVHRAKVYKYFMLLFKSHGWLDVNYEKSKFAVLTRFARKQIRDIEISSYEQLISLKNTLHKEKSVLGPKLLTLADSLSNYQLIGMFGIMPMKQNIIITANLLATLKRKKVTGADFAPANIIVEHQ